MVAWHWLPMAQCKGCWSESTKLSLIHSIGLNIGSTNITRKHIMGRKAWLSKSKLKLPVYWNLKEHIIMHRKLSKHCRIVDMINEVLTINFQMLMIWLYRYVSKSSSPGGTDSDVIRVLSFSSHCSLWKSFKACTIDSLNGFDIKNDFLAMTLMPSSH